MLTFALDRLGWFSFEQLCRTICRQVWGQRVETYTRGRDQGMDGFLRGGWATDGHEVPAVLQCKHSSTPGARLTKSNLTPELAKISRLQQRGLCEHYVLMTNLKVSATSANEVRTAIGGLGVSRVEIFGYEAVCEMLTENKDLRALVPRLYGLGDLTEIFDQRSYDQARTILAAMHDSLDRLVPVEAHRRAAAALDTRRFVVLTGQPGSGKSSIAASLAVGTLDRHGSRPVILSDIRQFPDRWNPQDPNQFFWLDDAFGSTQYDARMADAWNRVARSVDTAVRKGSRVIITSRDYIWSAAKKDLKLGQLPALDDPIEIFVEDFTTAERQQILYNHLKLGSQPREVLARMNPAHLEEAAAAKGFLPELARRLGDPTFTRGLQVGIRRELHSFFESPTSYLLELLTALDPASRAALGLIHRRNGVLESPVQPDEQDEAFLKRLGCSLAEVLRAFQTLDGSLVRLVTTAESTEWGFKHPSIGDAYAKWLADDRELLEEYVTTVRLPTLLATTSCGEVGIRGSIVIPERLFGSVIDRIAAYPPHDWSTRGMWGDEIFPFLERRCSSRFLELLVQRVPEVTRVAFTPQMMASVFESRARLAKRLLAHGIASEADRRATAEELIEMAGTWLDSSVFTSTWVELLTDDELETLDQQVMENIGQLDDHLSEHLDQSRGDIGGALDIIDGFEARYGPLPETQAARMRVERWDNWEPDHDYEPPGLSSVRDPEPLARASIFDDLV